MADIPRISVQDARQQLGIGEALLVCGYEEDDAKCRQMRLEGSIMLRELKARLPSLGKDHALIFYCA